jgi:hypothetical protein
MVKEDAKKMVKYKNCLIMETEAVYSAVCELFERRAIKQSWRIVVESDDRIILEKRVSGQQTRRRKKPTQFITERSLQQMVWPKEHLILEDIKKEMIIKEEKVDTPDSGCDWSGSYSEDVNQESYDPIDTLDINGDGLLRSEIKSLITNEAFVKLQNNPDEAMTDKKRKQSSEIKSLVTDEEALDKLDNNPEEAVKRKKRKVTTKGRKFDKPPCPICKKAKYGNKYLRNHILIRHPNFLTEAEKKEDEERQIAERTCTICSKVFVTKGGLAVHTKEIHMKDSIDDRTCTYCFKILSSHRRREEHVASFHQDDRLGGPFPCQFCQKLCGTKEQLRWVDNS